MRVSARLASTKLTLLSRLSTTRRTPNRQSFFLRGFHAYIVQRCQAEKWSILTKWRNPGVENKWRKRVGVEPTIDAERRRPTVLKTVPYTRWDSLP